MKLSSSQLRLYHEQGFLVVDDVFADRDLDPVRALLQGWTRDVVQELADGGYLSSAAAASISREGMEAQMARLDDQLPGIAMHLQENFMRDRRRVMELKAFRRLRSNASVLNMVEQLLETTEVAAHPNFMMRIRTPTPEAERSDIGKVPIHQDAGYLLEDARDTTVIGVWMPLQSTGAALRNGPMQFIKGGHKARRCLQHSQGPAYLLVEPDEFAREFGHLELVVDVAAGSVVLFNNFTPHCSLANTSGRVRWSFDMRYQQTGLPHGMGKNGGLVPLRSTDPSFAVRVWLEGPQGPTAKVLGAYGRKASAAALKADVEAAQMVARRPIPRLRTSKPGDSPRFLAESRSRM